MSVILHHHLSRLHHHPLLQLPRHIPRHPVFDSTPPMRDRRRSHQIAEDRGGWILIGNLDQESWSGIVYLDRELYILIGIRIRASNDQAWWWYNMWQLWLWAHHGIELLWSPPPSSGSWLHFTHTHTYTTACTQTHTHKHKHTQTHTHTHTHTHVNTHTQTHTYADILTYTHGTHINAKTHI